MQSPTSTAFPMEESALDWLRRVRTNKRRLNQNPICFPSDDGSAKIHHADDGRFRVTKDTMVSLSSDTFMYKTQKLNEIKVRLLRWQRRRTKQSLPSEKEHSNASLDLEHLLLQSFQVGTGIKFLDKLQFSSTNKDNVALEIIGPSGTAKTKVLMALASNYMAATCTGCLGPIPNPIGMRKQMPLVVIFDPEHAVDSDDLIGLVRASVLRRWNTTNTFRQSLIREKRAQAVREIETHSNGPNSKERNQMNDYKLLEEDITSALSRVHIVRPKDFSNGSVAALESLCRVLDDQSGKGSTPIMLLLDSAMSAFSQTSRFQESLPNGSGLSGRSDFIRQIKRLQSRHQVFMVSSRTIRQDAANPFRSGIDGWDKMTTHQISLAKSLPGSPEEINGYSFVALLKDGQSGPKEEEITPFSFTKNGISCGTA
eukprot:267031_1